MHCGGKSAERSNCAAVVGRGRCTVGIVDTELLLLLHKVASADEAHGDLVAEPLEELQNLRAHRLVGRSVSVVSMTPRFPLAVHLHGGRG